MIAIVDYGMGNLRSVQKGLERVGFETVVTRDVSQIQAARGVVLPGVGAFSACMTVLFFRTPVNASATNLGGEYRSYLCHRIQN